MLRPPWSASPAAAVYPAEVGSIEGIRSLSQTFDGVISNFGAMNCLPATFAPAHAFGENDPVPAAILRSVSWAGSF